MQKNLFICLSLIFVLIAGGCKKKKGAVVDLGDYQPLTTGSEWNYNTIGSTGNGAVNTSFKLSVTGKDTSSSARTYKVFTNSSGPNEYYNKTGNDYYRIASIAALPQPVEVLYFKDNLALGGSWSETKDVTISGIPFQVPVNINFVVEKNKFDTIVDGTSYKDVIKIRVTPTVSGLSISSDVTYYYARKVGLFYNKTIVVIPAPVSINVNTITKLTSYTIK